MKLMTLSVFCVAVFATMSPSLLGQCTTTILVGSSWTEDFDSVTTNGTTTPPAGWLRTAPPTP